MAVQLYDNSYHYRQRDVELLSAIAGHTVTAIDRVTSRELLEVTVRERTRQLQNINQSLQREIRDRTNAEKLQAALYKISELTANNSDMAGFYRQVQQILAGLMRKRIIVISLCWMKTVKNSVSHFIWTNTPHQRRKDPCAKASPNMCYGLAKPG